MANGKTKLVFNEGPLLGQAIITPVKDKTGVWSGDTASGSTRITRNWARSGS